MKCVLPKGINGSGSLFECFYPLRTITVTSKDSDYITPEIKSLVRCTKSAPRLVGNIWCVDAGERKGCKLGITIRLNSPSFEKQLCL